MPRLSARVARAVNAGSRARGLRAVGSQPERRRAARRRTRAGRSHGLRRVRAKLRRFPCRARILRPSWAVRHQRARRPARQPVCASSSPRAGNGAGRLGLQEHRARRNASVSRALFRSQSRDGLPEGRHRSGPKRLRRGQYRRRSDPRRAPPPGRALRSAHASDPSSGAPNHLQRGDGRSQGIPRRVLYAEPAALPRPSGA